MRIVQITPGSGDNFYCENCLRDAALVMAVRKQGHDIVMVPLYLPVQDDAGQALSDSPIFFGGINVYLQQKLSFFRKTPRWLDRVFDLPGLLRLAGRKAGMTSAKDLGETTLSMLRGENGRQVKELDRLVEWLSQADNRPDIVCLSNILLAGLVRRIKERLNVPVVCLLQDEDGFVDGLGAPYAEQAWQMLAERARDIDGFVAVSKYYAGVMQHRLALAREKVHVAYIGVPLDDYEQSPGNQGPPTIGFLSRTCFHHGLDTLVEAFIALKGTERLRDLRLLIMGGKSGNDGGFVEHLRERLADCGFLEDVEFLDDFNRQTRKSFFRRVSVLSVPEKEPVAYGLYVLEALASGVPVVQPAIGVFPELLEMTGGGVLFEPNDVKALVSALEPLLLDTGCARRLGQQGRQGIVERFDVDKTAEQLMGVYGKILERKPFQRRVDGY
jgi:glycosyltransferase involved in cell wall biosynthesis